MSSILADFFGRTAISADPLHVITVFVLNEDGVWLLKRYGRLPANSGPFRMVLAYQAHHLDTDFYETFYRP